ncbi:MAG: thrombospondin type 3 repeat-containing protein [Phycisphaerales bacterium]|nr:thrombospondin type 3 repeat-containing protein [Phycisphaerales bacterium]
MNARKQDQRLADKTRRAALLLLVATGSLLFASSDAQAGYAISRILDGLKFKPGKYFLPEAMTVDDAGNVFVAGLQRIQDPFEETGMVLKIAVDGEITELMDATGDGQGNTLGRPQAIAVDDEGNVYVGASHSKNVFMIAPSGNVTEILDESGDGNGHTLNWPNAIDIGPDGAVYVSEFSSDRDVFKIAPNGQVSMVEGNYRCTNMAVDGDGNVFTTSEAHDNVRRTDTEGNRTEVVRREDGLETPYGLTLDGDGNVFVAGLFSDNVLKRSPDGTITEVIGPDDGLIRPFGIALNSAGTLYVTASQMVNASGSRVFEVKPNGEVTRLINFRVPETNIYLNNAEDVVVDSRDVVYIAGSSTVVKIAPDADEDGVGDVDDNCPDMANTEQTDTDGDGLGDVCDDDIDGDGVLNFADNCPTFASADLDDTDGDGIGDPCDDCTDTDGDGFGDPEFSENTCEPDNCPDVFNENQDDTDEDGLGDACDECTDTDGDGFGNPEFDPTSCDIDNCPHTANPDQADLNGDGIGDACADDTDGDGILDFADNCPTVASNDLNDTDGDGRGDACDECTDTDGDGFGDPGFSANTCPVDNCPDTPNDDQADANGDGVGDACSTRTEDDTPGQSSPGNGSSPRTQADEPESDTDGDGVPDDVDKCPNTPSDATEIDPDGCEYLDTEYEWETPTSDTQMVTPTSAPCGAMGMIAVPLIMLGLSGFGHRRRVADAV